MKTYQGTRGQNGIAIVTVQGSSPSPLAARRKLRKHSPDGFEWGYAGSGPTQLALAILADHFGPGRERLATALYVDFKFAVVARLPRDGWTLTTEQIGQELCRLATEDEAHFWGRVVGTLDVDLFEAAIVATGKDPDPAELQAAAVRIITPGFAISEDYARRLVADYYAREGQQK